MKKLLTILFVTLFALSAHFGHSSEKERGGISEYRIGQENVLVINVSYGRGREMERKVRVSARGLINVPLLGEVEAAGLTINELEKKLTHLFEKDYIVNPQVSVFIEEYSTVSVLGQVNQPGNFEIKGKMSVVEALSQAGGFTKIANTNGVRVIRTLPDGTKKTIPVRVHDIINRGREDEDILLEPGDIVTVPESFF